MLLLVQAHGRTRLSYRNRHAKLRERVPKRGHRRETTKIQDRASPVENHQPNRHKSPCGTVGNVPTARLQLAAVKGQVKNLPPRILERPFPPVRTTKSSRRRRRR